jgi:hypothetical protein
LEWIVWYEGQLTEIASSYLLLPAFSAIFFCESKQTQNGTHVPFCEENLSKIHGAMNEIQHLYRVDRAMSGKIATTMGVDI